MSAVGQTYDIESFYDGLVEHGLIIPTAIQGGYGRGAVFEDILTRFNDLVSRSRQRRWRRADDVSADRSSRR